MEMLKRAIDVVLSRTCYEPEWESDCEAESRASYNGENLFEERLLNSECSTFSIK